MIMVVHRVSVRERGALKDRIMSPLNYRIMTLTGLRKKAVSFGGQNITLNNPTCTGKLPAAVSRFPPEGAGCGPDTPF
jgi:hypothetical protein